MTQESRHANQLEPMLGAIWAQANNGIIGDQGSMPWHVPEDLAHFKRVTAGHPVIMGRATWNSFPAKYRPLPGRTNIVLTCQAEAHEQLRNEGAVIATSLETALTLAREAKGGEEVWIIGGGKVYAQALSMLDVAVITKLDVDPAGDTSAPVLSKDFVMGTSDPSVESTEPEWHVSSSGTRYRFETWLRQKD
ncbi:dihydrofolate reductase [Glutamicibacter sp. AOP5-A2-18]|uniref:dihydrofolate reductase n=1 Tax=Glutamicibacter sp. AOP5-A2-18 TaxID=3457656 RepID=UPI004034DFA7